MALIEPAQLQEFTAPIQGDLQLFDSKLADYLRGDSPLISSIARHLLKSKGKRIRPAFLFLSSRASENQSPFLVDTSLAIELIHTATLLHDDVVDASELRRGQQTVNARWTNLISVLMGDYLFAKAFRIMVDTESLTLIDAISRATERVSVGELRQIEETSNYALSEEEYIDIIADKTASLFNVSCESGPILNRRSEGDRERFARFGEQIGIAFQIADDLLDFVGEASVTGKEPGNDLLNGKVTLPLIHAFGQVSEASGREMIALLKREHGTDSEDHESFPRILQFVHETGGIEYAYQRAEAICASAMEELESLPPSIYLDCLNDIVRFTTRRAS